MTPGNAHQGVGPARHSGLADRGSVVVVGGGVIGLAAASALGEAGVAVTLVAERRSGDATWASAGVLAPSLGGDAGAAHRAMVASRARYRGWIEWIHQRASTRVLLSLDGVLEVARTEERLDELRDGRRAAEWLDRAALARLEPALTPAAGAAFYPDDGVVDPVALADALTEVLGTLPNVRVVNAPAVAVHVDGRTPRVALAGGESVRGDAVVLAAGAWAATLDGLPRPLPVAPARGQIVELADAPVSRPTFGDEAYLVARREASGGARTLVGSTMEHVGFDASTTAGAATALAKGAARLSPALVAAAPLRQWAGLRPVTPDLLPIIGRDPDVPALIYACGHSKNGVLLAPFTADIIVALITGSERPADSGTFGVERFIEV